MDSLHSSQPESGEQFLSSFQARRFSPHRLEKVRQLKTISSSSIAKIEDILLTLKKRIDAESVSLYQCDYKDMLFATQGQADNVPLTARDEQYVFLGEALYRHRHYLQPVQIEGCVVGYLGIQIPQSQCTNFVQEMAKAYADLIQQELDLAQKKSSLDRLSQELREKKQALEQAQRYNDNLLSITSHDLSSPLNAVSGYLDLMNECFGDADSGTERMENYHQRIQSGIQDVMDMLNQLSDVGKIENGTLTLDLVEVNLCWLAPEVCELIKSNAMERNLHFKVEVPDYPIYVKADVTKLKRIVYNLVTNAVKYTDPGGSICVQVHENEDKVFLTVEDDGIGIPSARQADIFAPFVKLQELNHSFYSCGLGLYVVSYFTDLMDGRIEVQSEEGEGSIFIVELPKVAVGMSSSHRQTG